VIERKGGSDAAILDALGGEKGKEPGSFERGKTKKKKEENKRQWFTERKKKKKKGKLELEIEEKGRVGGKGPTTVLFVVQTLGEKGRRGGRENPTKTR